jgi:low temperature requirement protein LtrA
MSFRPIFGRPRLTQDWGEEQHERETHWTSLFYDLLIVAALNAIAEPFEEIEEESSGGGETGGDGDEMIPPHLGPIRDLWLNALLQFVSVITPWNSLNEYTAMFEDESFVGHLAFFVHCFGLASTTAGCVGSLEQNWPTLATGIILSFSGLLVMYVRPHIYIPRARAHCLMRVTTFLIVIILMAWGLTFDGPKAFERFRTLLIGTCIFSWLSLIGIVFLGDRRVPLHIQSYADRQKEVTST